MKIRILFSLVLAALLLFSACGGGSPAPAETAAPAKTAKTPATAETAGTAAETTSPVAVPHPLTRAELGSIPVANGAMTEEELREICVRFAVLQASFQWTPGETFKYDFYNAADRSASFQKGVIYGGLPYNHTASNLYHFLEYYDEETGVFDPAPLNGKFGMLLGNDCADALFWAWGRVSNTITYNNTLNMVPANGCAKIGPYVLGENVTDLRNPLTRKICDDNGEQTMFRSYAELKRADGLVMRYFEDGHAIMVMENHPVKGADGSVSASESYVIIVEQHSKLTPTVTDGVTVQVVGGVENRLTYADLFKRGYLPFTIAEFSGADPVEKAEATVEFAEEGNLSSGTVRANYCLSTVRIAFTDAEGNEAYTARHFCSNKDLGSYDLSTLAGSAVLRRNLKSGAYTVTVSAEVSTGETLTAFSGTYTQP